jgi:hypothetical protein
MPRFIAAGISTDPGDTAKLLGGDDVWSAVVDLEVSEYTGEVFVCTV